MSSPTPNDAINRLLQVLLANVQEILGADFAGLYLHGSLAGGDFTPGRSDIDFVVATAVPLPPLTVTKLAAMHADLRASDLPWVTELEGSYIPLAALRRYDPANDTHPHLGVDGHFAVEAHGSGWVIMRHTLREAGVALAGPPPQTLIDPVTARELRQATRDVLNSWWRPMLADAAPLRDPAYQAYAVLTMCRALYTLNTGQVATKTAAARWALQMAGPRRSALITAAMAWRSGHELHRLDETLQLIQFTLRRPKTDTAKRSNALK